ncbi:MAG: SLC13 family permease [Vulcanimicrobiota bacterium]
MSHQSGPKSGASSVREDDALDPPSLIREQIIPHPRCLRRARYGATAIAIRQRDKLVHENLGSILLRAGDGLLIEASRERLDILKSDPSFVLLNEMDASWYRRRRAPLAVAVFAGVVLAAALGAASIEVAAITGALIMVLSGCLTLSEAYRALDLKVLFLLAGALSLGTALEKTGIAESGHNGGEHTGSLRTYRGPGWALPSHNGLDRTDLEPGHGRRSSDRGTIVSRTSSEWAYRSTYCAG